MGSGRYGSNPTHHTPQRIPIPPGYRTNSKQALVHSDIEEQHKYLLK